MHGKPVPTAPLTDFLAQRADSPDAIPVEKISGPVFLDCRGTDKVWDSCADVAAIKARLAHGSHTRVTALDYPDAGHFVGALVPYMPSTLSTGTTASGVTLDAGGTFGADQAARAAAWPKLLAFLSAL